MLSCVTLPPFIEEQNVRKTLLNDYHLEVGGGLGPLKGKVWRIGLMGESSRSEYVLTFLSALEQVLSRSTNDIKAGDALKAAAAVYAQHSLPMQTYEDHAMAKRLVNEE